ncbi:23S rRNA (adenine(2503)-C(2))-methyltransferase RlmN [Balneolales bacterium ANBcel1]|nr:23S rRNA (adenine(2503)-C(2))-methyltransferase RlmN [Balneolales bacterium ANBcel1]
MNNKHHLLQKLPVNLKHLALKDWEELCEALGIAPASRKQVFEAVYHHNIGSPEEITSISGQERDALRHAVIIPPSVRESLVPSSDGSWKLTLRLHDGGLAETVIIPEWEDGKLRKCSASISSQIGCFFGCSFCATGKMGFHRNLSTGELIDQVREAELAVREQLNSEITHLYFMGMGEPMHNYRAVSDALSIMRNPSAPGPVPDRITVSTVGLYRQIRMLADDHPQVRLAVSIHSADQQTRREIMPVSARLGLPEIRDALIYHNRRTGHPATIQYLLMGGVNDRPEDADNLISYLDGLGVRITLIMYNDVPEAPGNRTEIDRMQRFRGILNDAGLDTDVRWCYGEDIDAGCGQLKIPVNRERVSVSMRHPAAES